MGIVTDGLVCELIGKYATGVAPGSGSLSTWKNYVNPGVFDGALTNFDFDSAPVDEGWVGDGSESAPYGAKWLGGGNAFVDLGGTIFDNLQDWTLEFWVDVPASASSSMRLFDCFQTGVGGCGAYVSSSSGKLYFFGYIGGNLYSDVPISTVDVRNGRRHIVITYGEGGASPDDYVRSYIAGQDGGSAVVTAGGTTGTPPANFLLGNRAALDRPFGGKLYTFRAYTIGFTATEALQNYNAGVLAASAELRTNTIPYALWRRDRRRYHAYTPV